MLAFVGVGVKRKETFFLKIENVKNVKTVQRGGKNVMPSNTGEAGPVISEHTGDLGTPLMSQH